MHRILMRTVVLDFPSDVHDAARHFWRQALAADVRQGKRHPEYHRLEHPAALDMVLVQNLTEGASRIHLDIEADDIDAEVGRLVAGGAMVVERIEDWVVMRDPGGLLFCVVPADLDPGFNEHARTVGDTGPT